jgi:tetratricopeptide (TPR) repeat protein
VLYRRIAGSVLKRHGFDDAATEIWEHGLSWLRERAEKEELSDDMKLTYAGILFQTQNLEKVESVLLDLIDSNPEYDRYNSLFALGTFGVVVARKGDREEVQRISEQLKNWEKPRTFGSNTYWRAAIAANLGEKENAVSLLQEALEQGYGYADLYCRMSLEPLWDYPPFVELIKPRD